MAQPQESTPSQSVRHTEAQFGLQSGTAGIGGEAETISQTRVTSPGRDAIRRFRRNWAAVLSLVVLVILILMAILAPLMHTASPIIPDYGNLDGPPSWHHWFGTDAVGRDEYSRLIYGLRVPFVVGFVGTAITVVLGTGLGLASGYFGGVIDMLLSRFTDVMFAFPGFLLALIVVSLYGPAFDPYFGGAGKVILLSIVFAIVGWPALMRFVRSLALGLKEQQFIEAARTSGTPSWRIIVRHLLPNVYGLILVQAAFIVVGVISTETVLSILGLGVEPPNPDLGQMLSDGLERMDISGWEVLFPALTLTIIILAMTFVGDGVRDAVDPRMNQ